MSKRRFGVVLPLLSLGWIAVGCGGHLDLGSPGTSPQLDGSTGSDAGNQSEPVDDASKADSGVSPHSDGSTGSPPTVINTNSVNQVDILFDIDNSASMGDKQTLLELAIPDLINRLVTPNCVDATGAVVGVSTVTHGLVACAVPGATPEFNPVQDMHLGIVSSSLGSRGGDVCYSNQVTNQGTHSAMPVAGAPFLDGMPSISSHADDQGHLLGRSAMSSLAGGTFPTNAETETVSTAVGGQNFIDWFPSPPAGSTSVATVGTTASPPAATDETSAVQLETDFANLVTGVHAFGCGIESQMESWYRFLIQPDPYAYIAPSAPGTPLPAGQTLPTPAPAPGSWVGYDKVIIQQRHDFLRPKSLVAVIVLSDENDSEIDTRSFDGQAYHFMVSGSTSVGADGTTLIGAFNPPVGTSACATNPGDPSCTSCAYCENGSPADVCNDPNCQAHLNGYTSPVDWGNDINLRHAHMKQKYGIVPQYPVERYFLGLTSPNVPDRTTEYPLGAASYQGGTAQPDANGALVSDSSQLNCTNPLFAPANPDGSTTLPNGSDMSPAALCNTAHPASVLGSRPTNLVFFAHIGGVPHQLLQAQPGVADPTTHVVNCAAGTAAVDCPQKDTLAQADWVSILGNGAASATPTSGESYDYTGIDPHMIESYEPRTPLTDPGAGATGGGPDPVNGREWTTNTSFSGPNGIQAAHYDLPVDLEYACTFPLVDPTSGAATPRDCSNTSDFFNQVACDCSPPQLGAPAFSATGPSPIPAVCGQCTATGCSQGGTGYNLQYYAKAYPTIREIELVHLMGPQGVLSSICPIHTSYESVATDPVFGYRPAINSIVNRLKKSFVGACLPQSLKVVNGVVPCTVLATLPQGTSQTCSDHSGLADPSSESLQTLQAQLGGAPSQKFCEVNQVPYMATESCLYGPTRGWCYVDGVAAPAGCAAAGSIVFQGAGTDNPTLPSGAEVILQCPTNP